MLGNIIIGPCPVELIRLNSTLNFSWVSIYMFSMYWGLYHIDYLLDLQAFGLTKVYISITLQKKSSYPNVFFLMFFKIAAIEKPIPTLFETVGIGNPIMAAQNRRFINHCNRRPIAVVSKYVGIGCPIATFNNHRYMLRSSLFFFLINLIFETILSRNLKSAGIGCPYSSTSKSAGIG